jgi:hypothetical protein
MHGAARTTRCCNAYVEVSLIEAAYMTHDLNKKLPSRTAGRH